MTMTTKERLHQLVDELPECDLEPAELLLAHLSAGDPLLRALLVAPEDDEPVAPEENRAADEARQEYLRGEGRPWGDVRAELAK